MRHACTFLEDRCFSITQLEQEFYLGLLLRYDIPYRDSIWCFPW